MLLICQMDQHCRLKVHHTRAVTRGVHTHRDRLELFYLPAYAPEHNPEEFLNNDRK
jgi:hypothetical protein